MKLQEAIAQLLTGTAAEKRMAQNLQTDNYLPASVRQELEDGLAPLESNSLDPFDTTRICDKIRKILTKQLKPKDPPLFPFSSHVPVGEILTELSAGIFGRVIPLDKLVEYWIPILPPISKDAARDWIEQLTREDFFTQQMQSGALNKCPLGYYICWSTFNEKEFDSDPFDNNTNDARLIFGTLGLDGFCLFGDDFENNVKSGKLVDPLCVFVRFKLPEGFEPHIPTCVEAYAGSGSINHYFKASTEVNYENGLFPRTMPIPELIGKEGRPEIVHSAISASSCTSALDIQVFRTSALLDRATDFS